MQQAEPVLHPASIIAELKKNNITHVVWLPDSETNFMYQQLMEDPNLDLGTLVTIGNNAPENLYHFVFENGVYAITGGQPIPGEGKASFQGMAKEAGYAAAYEFDDTEELATNIDGILQQKGPVPVRLKIVPEIEDTPVQFRHRPRRNMQIAIADLTKVFGR